MEPTPAPPADTPPDPRRWRWASIITGAVAATLLVALVAALAIDGDGDGENEDQAGPATTEESRTSRETTGDGPTTTSPPPDPTRGGAFDDGLWTPGLDIPPGRYIAAEINGDGCEWARLTDTTSERVIAAETDVAGQAIVDILDSDAAFRSSGCGTWALYTAPDPPPSTAIDEGDWVVGEQIEPGAYRVPQAPGCTWTRATGYEHTPTEVTQTQDTNIALEGPFLVTLAAGERFTTRGCDTWTTAD